ncbi:MAG: NACHT domain-containing protein [Spirillospora sp.]
MSVIALLVGSAGALLSGGVALNQILNNGQLNWNYAYLAILFGVLAILFDLYRGEVLASSLPDTKKLKGRYGVYIDQLRASVAYMETLGLLTQGEYVHRMEQVYVDVALRPRPPQDTAVEAIEMGAGADGARRPLTSFLEPGRILAVIGSPGSGKTTLVRHTALNLCTWQWRAWRRRVPVLIYLRDHAAMILRDEPCDLAEVAGSAKWLDGRVPGSWLRKHLAAKRCVVLLDGLDEVADAKDRKRVVAWIDGQMRRYQGNAFVITSRPHGYLSNPLPSADILQVQRFTTHQIAQFLRAWYYANDQRTHGATNDHIRKQSERKADDLFKGLRNRVALYHLAANPLLLTMIAHVHHYRGALPGSRAELYAEMCDVLIHRRQESKDLADVTGLDGPKKENVIRQLAFSMMVNELRDIPVERARSIIRAPLAFVAGENSLSAEGFLEEVRKSGLLVEREQGFYGFAHLTLQEYLAAAHIRAHTEYLRLIPQNVNHPWWRETTLLWAAAGDATLVITACLDARTFRALALAFDCADEAREIDPEVRARLEQAMRIVRGDDSRENVRHRRLVAAVTLSQRLRDIIWIDDRTAICAQPITRDDYNLFVPDERLSHRLTPDMPVHRERNGDSPASGIFADDAARFVVWVNNILQDGRGYRLPAPGELAKIDGQLVPILADHTPWASAGGARIQLGQAANGGSPRFPNERRLRRLPDLLAESMGDARVIVWNRGAWTDPDMTLALGYINAFGDIAQGVRDIPHQKLVVTLDFARELLLHVKGTSPAIVDFSDLNDVLDKARGHCSDVVTGIRVDLEHTRDHNRRRNLDQLRIVAESLAWELEQQAFTVQGLADHQISHLARSDSPYDRTIPTLVSGMGGSIQTAIKLARTIDRFSVRGIHAVDETDLRQTLDIAERITASAFLGSDRHGVGIPDETRLGGLCWWCWTAGLSDDSDAAHRLQWTFRPVQRDPQGVGHGRARELALALGATPGFGRHALGVMTTYEVLLREAFGGPLTKKLAELVAKAASMAAFSADDPAWNLRQAMSQLQHVEFWHTTGLDRRYLEKVIGLGLDIIPPMLERRAPFDARTVHLAMASILAALVLVRPLRDMDQPRRHLASAFVGLAAISDRVFADTANDVILLVRS